MSGLNKKAILTLVSNVAGYGPGHSAIVALDKVYTFEAIAGFYGDSWLIVDVREYLNRNTHRPVVVQELNDKVDLQKVMKYVSGSMGSDHDFLGSGVCSSQVAHAISAATSQSFNPTRVDTPMEGRSQAIDATAMTV